MIICLEKMKLTKEDKELIEEAKQIIAKSRPVNLIDTGDVGSALKTPKGNIFRGVSLGFFCGIGSCGEYQAIGSMISNGEKEIKTIVAVWYDEKTKKYEIIPPCGKCREMINQASKKNQNTEVIISKTKKVRLKELLPHAWDGSLEK
jgi:cytidine deaminase|tara:strand:- start:158 stop:598 length:441 start_codon:yes stop_codon:yes gene_type:complete